MKHKIEIDEHGRITHAFTLFYKDMNPEVGIEVDEHIDIEKYCWDLEKNEKKLKKEKKVKINKTDAALNEEIVITDLLNPTTIKAEGVNHVITDGTFRFTPKERGKTKILIRDGLDLNKEMDINVT